MLYQRFFTCFLTCSGFFVLLFAFNLFFFFFIHYLCCIIALLPNCSLSFKFLFKINFTSLVYHSWPARDQRYFLLHGYICVLCFILWFRFVSLAFRLRTYFTFHFLYTVCDLFSLFFFTFSIVFSSLCASSNLL